LKCHPERSAFGAPESHGDSGGSGAKDLLFAVFRASDSAIMMRIMIWQSKVALILLSVGAMIAGAQSSTENRRLVQEARERGYWVDPSTGLMWAATDNGKDLNWHKAIRYCRDLQLTGNSDWRLPTIEELEGIYDGSESTGNRANYIIAGKPKGGLFLTGTYYWSSSPILDDRGHRSGYGLEFDFFGGRRHEDPLGYTGHLRALCVRHSGE
jgi:hypothetical protein